MADQQSSKKSAGGKNAIELLKADHREVEKMFAEFEKASDSKKEQLVEQICKALTIHAMLEEEIFYPACREKISEEDMLDEAQVEHDSVKILIAEVWGARSGDPFRDAKVKVMGEQVKHHVGEEEKPRSGIFAKAQSAGIDLNELGEEMAQRKAELEEEDDLAPGEPVSIQGVSHHAFEGTSQGNRETTKERMMASMQESRSSGGRSRGDDGRGSRSGGRERDEDGRFTSSRGGRDDDDDRSRRSRSRDDDDRGGRSSRNSYDDDDRRGRSGRGRDDDDRGRGGWFGDSEGHSRAAQRGWDDRDDRGSSRSSRGRDDDDRGGRSSRGGRDDDRGSGGWFGDSRGHSEAARRGWEDRDDRGSSRSSRGRDDDDRGGWSSRGGRDDDRGRGGWFGDSRGHSEAARRGWEDRDDRGSSRSSRGRDDDDRGGRSSRGRGRDDDDRGRGGWFGDSRGHSEAARRGWDSRH